MVNIFGDTVIMKIAQINPGHLPIPPKNWGAVEKIIWACKLNLEKLGHTVDVKYINEIEQNQYDIVHTHMWNHALEMRDKGIPYVFTFHDHHAYIYGKNSAVYKNNLLAIKQATLAIVPAKYLVSYFDSIPVYLSHGVDRDFFVPGVEFDTTKLLCVGNNGFGGDSSFDRKGFGYAIEAARTLNLPITVVGPTNYNKAFFESHPELKYDKLTIKYDLTDDELVSEYHNHSLLIHATNVEAGHPPLTILEAASCGLPVLTTDCSGDLFSIRVERDSNSIVEAIKSTIELYPLNQYKTLESVSKFDWFEVTKNLEVLYSTTVESSMLNSIVKVYNKLEKRVFDNAILINFIDGPKFEMVGPHPKEFTVRFIDKDTNELVYETRLQNNQWAKASRRWFTNWRIQIDANDGRLINHDFNATGKRVLISLESSSLGDTIAWIPYALEFKRKHNCHVIVSSFNDELFRDQYPELEFVKPGTVVDNLYALYRLGLFYDNNSYDGNCHKSPFLDLSLQGIASDILGLEHKEILPRITKPTPYVSDRPYICIANHSTAQAKYWNNRTGWQEVVDYAKSKGYDVYLLSKEDDGFMGNKNPNGVIKIKNKTLEEIGSILLGAKLFVGLGSGLSWYAWALEVPTILISGFSEPYQEMTNGVHRIHNDSVCNGCFAKHYFNRGDWNWCPEHKGTPRQFECTKHITFDMVKPYLDMYL